METTTRAGDRARRLTAWSALAALLCSALTLLAAAPPPKAADIPATLLRSPVILDRDLVLRDFRKGRERTYVIVNLAQTAESRSPGAMRGTAAKSRVRTAVRAYRDRVVSRLDPSSVRVLNRFSYMPGFSAEVDMKGLESLLAMPEVASVEKDVTLRLHTAQGIPLMNAQTVRGPYSGQGLSIAVCDSGIDYTHPRLGGPGFPNAKVIGGYDFGGSRDIPESQDTDPRDVQGHGTKCAGIAAGDLPASGSYAGGVAHSARLYALKVTHGTTGEAYLSDMVSSWEWCVTNQDDNTAYPIMIITMSMGGEAYDEACDSASPAMTGAAASAAASGITIFASSGNEGLCGALSFPACISNVISVASVFDANIGGAGWCVDPSSCAPNQGTHASCDPDPVAWAYTTAADMAAPYSNVAPFLDLFAPANNASTTALGGAFSTTFGGTSAACPYAAGAAACMQSAARAATGSFLSPAEVRAQLTGAGDPITYAAAGITRPRVNLGNADIDGDGLPAGWEVSFFSDLSHDGGADGDRDDLSDGGEYHNGTDPTDPDTDDDGWTDGQEVLAGTSPIDPESHPLPVETLSDQGLLSLSILMLIVGLIIMGKSTS